MDLELTDNSVDRPRCGVRGYEYVCMIRVYMYMREYTCVYDTCVYVYACECERVCMYDVHMSV